MVNLLIPGFAKSASSSLLFHLNNHSKICARKGTNYFSHDMIYDKGESHYESLFDCHDEKYICEKNPRYSSNVLFHKCAKRIFEYNSDISLVWIFRNPVDRAYSHYWYYAQQGKEFMSFRKAVQKEFDGKIRAPSKNYVKSGRYALIIKEYLDYFNLDQMHFILFEDFVKNTKKVMLSLFDYLNIAEDGFVFLDKVKNQGGVPLSKKMLYATNNIFGRKSYTYKIVNKINQKLGKKDSPEIPEDLYIKLREYYKPYNKELQEVVDIDVLTAWNKS